MPWAAPIGSAKGITNRDALKLLRDRLPDITLVVDAGIGAPSHAAHALELGYDAVLLNTAIAKAAAACTTSPSVIDPVMNFGVHSSRPMTGVSNVLECETRVIRISCQQ